MWAQQRLPRDVVVVARHGTHLRLQCVRSLPRLLHENGDRGRDFGRLAEAHPIHCRSLRIALLEDGVVSEDTGEMNTSDRRGRVRVTCLCGEEGPVRSGGPGGTSEGQRDEKEQGTGVDHDGEDEGTLSEVVVSTNTTRPGRADAAVWCGEVAPQRGSTDLFWISTSDREVIGGAVLSRPYCVFCTSVKS